MIPPLPFDARPPACLVVVRYVLLAVTTAIVLGTFLLFSMTWSGILGALFAGASGVAAAYRRSLLEKLVFVVAGLVAIAGISVGDWYYGKASTARDLFRRFSRVSSFAGVLLAACHLATWLLGGRSSTPTLLLAGGELVLGVALFALSCLRVGRGAAAPEAGD